MGRIRVGGIFAVAIALAFYLGCFIAVSPAQAETYKVSNNDQLVEAVNKATSGDTIELDAGTYTLHKQDADVLNKDLTFVGAGTDKTTWLIGPKVPDPAKYGTEYNSDYSFDVRSTSYKETVTFKDMTLQSGSVDYLGFAGTDNTVVENCVIEGKTFYWGYTSATFMNTTFNAPTKETAGKTDYAIWTYSSPEMTFDGCTFNCSGKAINVYTDWNAGRDDINVNVNNCTFNFSDKNKTALKINDSNMGDSKYIINLTGTNTVTTDVVDTNTITCSRLFGFDPNENDPYISDQNTGRTDVSIDGLLVWTDGEMQTHSYTDGFKEGKVTMTTEWSRSDKGPGYWNRTDTYVCSICNHTYKDYGMACDLSYDMNGSTDTQAQADEFKTVEHAESCTITSAIPTREGYKFIKWNTAADGSGTDYAPGDDFTSGDDPVTLYAQWEKSDSSVTPSNQTPSKSATTTTTSTSPKTADAINIALPAAIAVLAVAVLTLSLLKRRKN